MNYHTDSGPLPGTVIVIHPESELRGIYTRRLRDHFVTVESCASVDDLPELFHVHRPDILVIHVSALDSRAQRALRLIRQMQPQLALVSVGKGLKADRLAQLGVSAHIDEDRGRIGDVVEAVRRTVANAA